MSSWLQYLTFVVIAVSLRWLAGRIVPNPDGLVVAAILIGVAAYRLYVWNRNRAKIEMLNHASPAERATLISESTAALTTRDPLPELVGDEDAALVEDTFSYPPRSASLNTVLFWLCWAFAVGALFPLFRGQVSEASDAWMLFVMAIIFGIAALGYRLPLYWIGSTITIGPMGITEVTRGGSRLEIKWADLTLVKLRRDRQGLGFWDRNGKRLTVWTELQDYGRFLALLLRKLGRY